MRAAARMVAGALQRRVKRDVDDSRRVYEASVVRWASPTSFALDVHGASLPMLDDDDVRLSQSVRAYVRDAGGLPVGATLTIVEVDDGEYIAIGVEDDDDPPEYVGA